MSVFPSMGYIGNVSFFVTLYDAELDFVNRAELPIVAGAGETYIFYSESYSEAGDTRKIVVDGRGANVYLSGYYLNCNPRDIGSINNCIELPPKTPNQVVRRYYQVYFDNAFNGKVYLGFGVCGGVPTIVISMVLLMVVLFI